MTKNKTKWLSALFILIISAILALITEKSDKMPEEANASSGMLSFIDSAHSVAAYSYHCEGDKDEHTIPLKDLAYDFYTELRIPGMPATRKEDLAAKRITNTSQCPQGMCITDDFILLSSYSPETSFLGQIAVFDKNTGDYLTSVGLDSHHHLGGIAYDGENVWVCNSDDDAIERISYDFITLMAASNPGTFIDATEMTDVYETKASPSCITYNRGRLWVGTHNITSNSTVYSYHFDDIQNQLTELSTYDIPPRVQGIAFSDTGMVYLSSSYGRKNSSWIYIYPSLSVMAASPNTPAQSVELPPCSEEIFLADGILYVLFESAGEKYFEGTDGYGKSLSPIDQILKIYPNSDGFFNN